MVAVAAGDDDGEATAAERESLERLAEKNRTSTDYDAGSEATTKMS